MYNIKKLRDTHLASTFPNLFQRTYLVFIGAWIFVTLQAALLTQDIHAKPSEYF